MTPDANKQIVRCADCPAESAWAAHKRLNRILVSVLMDDVPRPIAHRRLNRIAEEFGQSYADAIRADLRALWASRDSKP